MNVKYNTLAGKLLHYYGKGFHKIMSRAYRSQKYFLPPSSQCTIVDAGANVGSAAFAYSQLFPGSRILCYEPDTDTREVLSKNLRGLKHVELFPFALGSASGEKTFYRNIASATNSLYLPREESIELIGIDAIRSVGKIEVRVERLDEHLESQKIERVDLLKMDLQGGELDCLLGASKYLGEGKIRMIYSEIEFVRLYQGQPLWGDVGKFLDEHGFILADLFNLRRRKGRLLWGDALFVRHEDEQAM